MKKSKQTYNILLLVAILITMVTISFGVYEYHREHAFRIEILHAQLQLNNYHYLEGNADTTIRITVVDTLGNVVYDTETKDVSNSSNHLQREEIKQAMTEGVGYTVKRTSETNGEKYFYSATRFDDIVVRSSVPYDTPLTATLENDNTFFYYTFGIFILIFIVFYLRNHLAYSEQEKQRIKHQLTENAAHELKTPAATIEGYLETLVSNPNLPDEKRNDFINRCYIQSRRMSNLLQDMNMLTRLDEAVITHPTTEVDIAQILWQIAEETKTQFEKCQIALKLEIPQSLKIQADANLLDSLFRNIFNNTLAYATGATYFAIVAENTSDKILIQLADNGPGVPPEHQQRIFERFYRIDKGRSRRLGGTGLGLAIVKNIVLQYNGKIEASTTPGGGLTLTISLPK
ncbi:MAG: HAMP domain-containing sensor histidine kinase [Bacteroidales bacterium]|nr:HAMP domain-containing sensor histidine kinase [Bacteroidales bacterium]